MRKYIITLLILVIGSIVVFELRPQVKYNLRDPIYHRLKERIFGEKPARFDTAFIGSSHIWNAVDTEYINSKVPGQYTYNFGVNWFGNDTKLVILRDLINRKPVGRVVLEITSGVDREVHEYFKFMATLGDIPRFTREMFADVSCTDVLTMSKKCRTATEHVCSVAVPLAVKGLYFEWRDAIWRFPVVSPEDHDGFLPIKSIYNFSDGTVIVSESDDSRHNMALSSSTLAIARLCKERKIPLYFLFVPQRNEAYPGPKFVAELSRWGRVLVLDSRQIYSPGNWYDPRHLNTAGARIFTDMLLMSELFQGVGR